VTSNVAHSFKFCVHCYGRRTDLSLKCLMNIEEFISVVTKRLLMVVIMTMMVMMVTSVFDNRAIDLLPILIDKGRSVNETVVSLTV